MEQIKRGTPFSDERNPGTVQMHASWLGSAITCSSHSSVLDIGCGQGVHEKTLVLAGCDRIVGIDVNSDSLVCCRSGNQVGNYVQANGEMIPLKDESFDVVIMVEVIEHIDNQNSCLREIFRVLRPGGRLLVTAPNKGFPFITHGITINERWFDTFLGIPFPLISYLPRAILRRIWSARCYTAREIEAILIAEGFEPRELVFLMPGFDGILPTTSKIPKVFMRRLQSLSHRFNSTESAWFGSTIAVAAVKGSADFSGRLRSAHGTGR